MAKKTKELQFNPKFIDLLPNIMAIIDDKYQFIYANKGFIDNFGPVLGKFASEIISGVNVPFKTERIESIFSGKEEQLSYKTEYTVHGINIHFTINVSPLVSDDGVKLAVVVANNISGTNHWQKEFNILFEKVPAFISILDREHNIIRANERFRDTFGDVNGKHGYDGFHKKRQDIINCPAENTYHDMQEHVSTVSGFTLSGERIYVVVNSVPLAWDAQGLSLVMEIAIDITEINHLQEQLRHAHDFYNSIIENSVDGIVAITHRGKTQIINKEAKRILSWHHARKPGIKNIQDFLPAEFFNQPNDDGVIALDLETFLRDNSGREIPVKFSAFELMNKKQSMGKVAFFHDLSLLKSIEQKKVEAEKEAFKYTFQSVGVSMEKIIQINRKAFDKFEKTLNTNNIQNIKNSWFKLSSKTEIRNEVIETFIRYAKGFKPELKLVNPIEVINKIKDFGEKEAKLYNIPIEFHFGKDLSESLIDSQAIYDSVKILMANSFIACIENDDDLCKIKVFADQRQGHLIIDVFDTCKKSEKQSEQIGFLTIEMIMEAINGMIDISENNEFGSRYSVIMPIVNR